MSFFKKNPHLSAFLHLNKYSRFEGKGSNPNPKNSIISGSLAYSKAPTNTKHASVKCYKHYVIKVNPFQQIPARLV